MAEHPPASFPALSTSTSRTGRASTLPSSEASARAPALTSAKGHKHHRSHVPYSTSHNSRQPPSHSHQHHQHNPRPHGFSRAATDSPSNQTAAGTTAITSTTSPFSELLSPVKSVGASLTAMTRGLERGGAEKDDSEAEASTVGAGEENDKESKTRRAQNEKQVLEQMRQAREMADAIERSTSARYDDLTSTVMGLHSTLTTTHASILSALPELSSRLSQLRAISASSAALLHSFTRVSAPALSSEFDAKLASASAHFDAVERERIRALQDRVDAARRRMEDLDRRMEKVRERVRAAESAEALGGLKRRRRTVLFGVVWAVALVLLVVVLIVTKLDDGIVGNGVYELGREGVIQDGWPENVPPQTGGDLANHASRGVGKVGEIPWLKEKTLLQPEENLSSPKESPRAADPLEKIFAEL